jgi:multidrug efflux pump
MSTPLSIFHQGGFAAATTSFNLPPGVSLSTAQAAIERTFAQIGAPSSIYGGFQGTARLFTQSLDSQPLLILAAFIAMYIVLGMLYESTLHPVTILSTLPSAGVGALLALIQMAAVEVERGMNGKFFLDQHGALLLRRVTAATRATEA